MFQFIKNWLNEGNIAGGNLPENKPEKMNISSALQLLREKNETMIPEPITPKKTQEELYQEKFNELGEYVVSEISNTIIRSIKYNWNSSYNLVSFNISDGWDPGSCCTNRFNKFILDEKFIESLRKYIIEHESFQNDIEVKFEFSESYNYNGFDKEVCYFEILIRYRIKSLTNYSDYHKFDEIVEDFKFKPMSIKNTQRNYELKFGKTFSEIVSELNQGD